MPAITTCTETRYEQHWNVATDDFVIPAFLSVVTSLFSICLIVAVLFTLFVAPGCSSVPVPPLLYGSFFALLVILVITAINETVILAYSSRGTIFEHDDRLHTTKFIYIKLFLTLAEFSSLIACTVAIADKKTRMDLECDGFENSLKLSLAVVVIQWIIFAGLLLKTALYLDPCGCFSPGLLERLSIFDDSDNKGSLVISTARAGLDSSVTLTRSEQGERKQRSFERTDSFLQNQFLTANHLHYWERKRPNIFNTDIPPPSFEKIESIHSKVHNADISQRKMERRLRAICCCLGIRGQRSRGVALEDVARGLYTIFSETDVVLSDIVAGFHLLHEHQKKKTRKGKSVVDKFRKVIFRMMPSQQRLNLSPNECRPAEDFDFSDLENQILFEDLVHYMHYAMGVYGWPLHIFDNLMCGLCQLCSVTCCRCQYRCFSTRAKGEGGEFIKDLGCCMCGVGVMRLRTGIKTEDIIYMTDENKIYGAPFSVCVDREMKAVVICVRGTLSLRDTLTDMSFSPLPVKVGGVKEAFVHGGMLRAALLIDKRLKEKNILGRAFEGRKGYQLVVTGHSLGAGVASVLSLLLKLQKRQLVCYAFSPPGALFSFPLAEYSKNFITTVVVGNDIVPRITLRALLHLKFSVQHQLHSCRDPKYKVLFLPKWWKKLRKWWSEERRKRRSHKGGTLQTDGGEGGEGGEGVEEVDGAGGLEEEEEEDIEDQVVNEFTTQEWMRSELFSRQPSYFPTESTDGRSSQPSDTARQSSRRQQSRPYLKTPSRQYARQTSHEYLQKRQHNRPSMTPSLSQDAKDLMQKFRRATSIDLVEEELPASPTTACTAEERNKKRIVADDASVGDDEPDSGLPFPQDPGRSRPSHFPPHPAETTTAKNAPPSLALANTALQQPSAAKGKDNGVLKSMAANDIFRPSEVCTPGSAIHNALPNIFEHCRYREGDMFLPSFPPGRIIHIEFPATTPAGCLCRQNELEVKEVPSENFSVILVDRGIVEDHLPNQVLHHLKVCKALYLETNEKYDPEALKQERESRYLARQRLGGSPANPSEGFIFTVQSPDGTTTTTHKPSHMLDREREQRLQRQQLAAIEEERLSQHDTTSLSSRVAVEVHYSPSDLPPPTSSNNHESTQVSNHPHNLNTSSEHVSQLETSSDAIEEAGISMEGAVLHLKVGPTNDLLPVIRPLSVSPRGGRFFKRQENAIDEDDGHFDGIGDGEEMCSSSSVPQGVTTVDNAGNLETVL